MKNYIKLLSICLVFVYANAQAQRINKEKNTTMNKVIFNSEGLNLAGHLYFPEDFDKTKSYPAVIVGGSLTSVKEQMAGTYAEELTKGGIIALAFDYSHFGESEGQPRQYEDPKHKLRDLKSAVSYLSEHPNVDSIGALGICTSGGNVVHLASEDSRVKAIVTVAGWFPDEETLPLLYGSEDHLKTLKEKGRNAKKQYAETGENEIVLAYSNIDTTASHFGPMEYYMDSSRGGGVSAWKNEFSVMSWESWLGFDPIPKAKNVKTPTLIIHSDGSALPDNAKKLYNNLKGEKELVWLEGNHFDFYDNPKSVSQASRQAINFFKQNLK